MSTTTNYGWTKPTVGADADTWGSELNGDLDGIDTAVAAVSAVAASAAVHQVPSGGIILWSGAQSAIPAGWVLCNGTAGAPDLRGLFVMGSTGDGGAHAVGSTGGASAHSHNLTVATHALTTPELPLHSHGVSDPGHLHTINDPGHGHGVTDPGHSHGGVPGLGGASVLGGPNPIGTTSGTVSTGSAVNGISVNSATNGLSLNTASTGISTQNTGSGTAHGHSGSTSDSQSLIPPYYALCYIMKT